MTLSLGRNYGFVHTSAEVLQQVNYLFEHEPIADELRPLIFRPNTIAGFDATAHVQADVYVIELSSRKLLLIDGVPVQLNYVARRYQDFFANKARSRMFWSRAVPDRLAERLELLREDAVFQRLDRQDADLLSRIERRDMSDAEIERDMAKLVELIGRDRIVFVTHVNADTPDGVPIEARRQLIQSIKSSARRLKATCYDPTALMKRAGQLHAMENDGLDLTHYTEAFSESLCTDLYKRFFAPRMASVPAPIPSSDAATQTLAPSDFASQWALGNHIDVSRRLHDYVRAHPYHHAHRMVLGEIHFELGDFEGACAHLEAARAGAGPNEKSDRLLMQAYFDMGAFEQARRIAVQMLAEEVEAPDIVRLCAIAADRLGDANSALTYWKRLFRLNKNDAQAADAVLAGLGNGVDLAAADDWASEVLEALPAHEGAFAFRWTRSLQCGDREGLLRQANEPIRMDEAKTLGLAQLACLEGMPLPAAVLAQTHGFQSSAEPATRAWVRESAAAWLRLGVASFETDALSAAADYLQSAWLLQPTDSATIRARRSLAQKMRRDLRQAFIGKDYADVFRIAGIAQQTQSTFPELHSLVGRSHFALGDYGNAFVHLKQAVREEGASLNERVQFARAASRSNQYGEAMIAYREVLSQSDAQSWSYKEAELELARLETRTERAARERLLQGDHDGAAALLQALRAAMPDSPAFQTGMQRLLAALRAEVKALEPASADRRLMLGLKMLKLDPQDEVGLRAAAIGSMRTYRFADALTYWQALRLKAADPTQIDLNIQKCQLWITRDKRKSVA